MDEREELRRLLREKFSYLDFTFIDPEWETPKPDDQEEQLLDFIIEWTKRG